MNVLKRITNYPAAFMCCLLLAIVTLGLVNMDDTLKEEMFPFLVEQNEVVVIDAPLPLEYGGVVSIKHFTPDGTIAGGGVLLQHKDALFVLTSSMVFPGDVGTITVFGDDDIGRTATAISESEELGLMALSIEAENLVPYELTDEPNLPVGDDVLTYLRKNPDWMVVDGVYITGEPIFRQDDLVGIVIGVNSVDENQAIVAGNNAIVAFADSLTEETKDDVQEKDEGRSVQKVRQTKSNLRQILGW
jgi:hypothetical protein